MIQDKQDRFSLRTIVSVVWALARIDFTNSKAETVDLLAHFSTYERLMKGLPTMNQKSTSILLWSYTRDPELLEKCLPFVYAIVESMLMFET